MGSFGLVGFVGTELIEGTETARWLRRFDSDWPSDDLETFCSRLASLLTKVWRRDALRSVLEILVAGEISGDLQFWFVRSLDRGTPEVWTDQPVSRWARVSGRRTIRM